MTLCDVLRFRCDFHGCLQLSSAPGFETLALGLPPRAGCWEDEVFRQFFAQPKLGQHAVEELATTHKKTSKYIKLVGGGRYGRFICCM